jgi:hypothetical protein
MVVSTKDDFSREIRFCSFCQGCQKYEFRIVNVKQNIAGGNRGKQHSEGISEIDVNIFRDSC